MILLPYRSGPKTHVLEHRAREEMATKHVMEHCKEQTVIRLVATTRRPILCMYKAVVLKSKCCTYLFCSLKLNINTAWISINLRVCSVFIFNGPSGEGSFSLSLFPHQSNHPITSYILGYHDVSENLQTKNTRQFLFCCSLLYDVMEICAVHVPIET
jgi:hypothetical protein